MSAVNQFRRAALNALGNSTQEVSFVPPLGPAVNHKSLFGQLRSTMNVLDRRRVEWRIETNSVGRIECRESSPTTRRGTAIEN